MIRHDVVYYNIQTYDWNWLWLGERVAHLVRPTEGIQSCQGRHFGSLQGQIDKILSNLLTVYWSIKDPSS